HQHRGLLQRLLAGAADLVQHDVARITLEFVAAEHRPCFILLVIARSGATKQSRPSPRKQSGLLRFARNDERLLTLFRTLFAEPASSCYRPSRCDLVASIQYYLFGFVMRSWLTATLMLIAAASSAAAPATAGPKPKSVAAARVRPPAVQTPADTASAMAQGERLALQSDLAWVGQYNGAITGDVSERMVAAIKEYQKNRGGKPTGVLNPQERAILAETARRRQDNVGWKIVSDTVTGARLGIPARLADVEKKDPAGRTVDYTVIKPDFFVLSGLQGLKKFYVRGTFKGDEVRIMTILYDQATENTVEPAVIAMSSAFNAFPAGQGPAPRKTVEYSTGIVVTADGAILADREATEACQAIAVQ